MVPNQLDQVVVREVTAVTTVMDIDTITGAVVAVETTGTPIGTITENITADIETQATTRHGYQMTIGLCLSDYLPLMICNNLPKMTK